ncbi:MAG: NYN domain-containing protein [Streptosporangiaceae bacterium]
MDRCAILVDAGYLLGAAGSLLGGDADRAGLLIDYATLTEALIAEAGGQTGLPVLRLLWYDGAFDSKPTSEHRALRVLPDVKVRLGELVKRAGKTVQKGVDSYLQRDLTTLARNHAVADVVLIGGDEDLRRALEEAQDYGMRVHLWGVEAAAPEYNQSQSLIAEADRRWVIPGEWIGRFIQARTAAPEPPSSQPDAMAEALTLTDGGSTLAPRMPPPIPARPEASPEDLARLAAAFGRQRIPAQPSPPAGGRGWAVISDTPDDSVPRLRDLATSRQAWQDNEDDAILATDDPAAVGARFGHRWSARANDEHLEALLADRPILPRRLDGELLRYAERLGIDTWEDEDAKHRVRSGFWHGIDQHGDDDAAEE